MSRADVVILGTGGGAMAAAITAAEHGARVTLVERDTVGGTCVNVGCIPSKIMIRAAQVAHVRRHSPFDAGIGTAEFDIDPHPLNTQRHDLVEAMRTSKYEKIIESNPGLSLLRGEAVFAGPHELRVSLPGGGEQRLAFDYAVIATGARPAIPPIEGLDGTPYWTSTEALASEDVPGRLIVVGSSIVALELGQACARLGSRVTLVARRTLMSRQDPAVGAALERVFSDEGISVLQHAAVHAVTHADGVFALESSSGPITADRLLVATGRAPNTERLNLEEVGIETERGAICVNDNLQTRLPHVYAVGDCTALPAFVYVAAAAGSRAARHMLAGESVDLDLRTVPAVVFTDPQIATVGLSEYQAIAAGRAVEARMLSLDHVPRALVNFDTRGFIKMVADAETGELLGVQAVAAEAGEMIQAAALAIAHRMTVGALGERLFPYLTMAEGMKLCAQTFRKDVRQLSCCAA